MSNPFEWVESIHFVDVGCSGSLAEKWADLSGLLVYVGFDPNQAECQRLSNSPHPYRSARYLPYAVAGEKGTRTLYKTENIYCYSLLRPRTAWVNRFTFGDYFREAGTEPVVCTTLGAAAEEYGVRADILKIDSQGLDLEILRSAGKLLDDAFCVETEPGLTANYEGENTFAPVDEFLRARGYCLFDLKVCTVARRNELSAVGKHQPLWCEAVYLFDYVGAGAKPAREQALKALRITRALGCADYGLELAGYFSGIGLLAPEELAYLRVPDHWKKKRRKSRMGRLVSLLPAGAARRLLNGARQALDEE